MDLSYRSVRKTDRNSERNSQAESNSNGGPSANYWTITGRPCCCASSWRLPEWPKTGPIVHPHGAPSLIFQRSRRSRQTAAGCCTRSVQTGFDAALAASRARAHGFSTGGGQCLLRPAPRAPAGPAAGATRPERRSFWPIWAHCCCLAGFFDFLWGFFWSRTSANMTQCLFLCLPSFF